MLNSIFENKYTLKIIAFILVCLLTASLFTSVLAIITTNKLINQLSSLQSEITDLGEQVSEQQYEPERYKTYSPTVASEYSVTDASREYALKKIDEVNDKIINREAVQESYFYFLQDDEKLLENIKTYNTMTGALLEYFTEYALSTVCIMSGLYDEDGKILHQTSLDYTCMPAELHELVDKISIYALQDNCADLIRADSSLEQIRVGELGGSYGMWNNWIHGALFEGKNEIKKNEYLKYQELIKEISLQFDEYRRKQFP